MRELILVGNPNAGKSTLFNRITGGHAKVGNWHGVTVGVTKKRTKLLNTQVEVSDLPGIYAVDAMSLEEKLACEYVLSRPDAPMLFVSECASLDRSLPLLYRLAGKRKVMLVLTKRKLFTRAGGKVDVAGLSARLKIPVIVAEELSKRRLKDELSRFLFARGTGVTQTPLTPALYTPEREGLSRTDRLLTDARFCIPLFFALLVTAFFLTFAPNMPGDFLKNALNGLFTETLAGKARKISSPVLRSFVADGLLTSVGGVLGFLPQIAMLYLFLILLEESGLMSRLAVVTDSLFSRFGLNGRALFSLLMGFGCSAAAIASTRGLDDKKIQRRTILCLPYISCSAKLPVYLALSASFFRNPFVAVLLLYALGVGLSLITAFLLKDKSPPAFVLELAPLQMPRPVFVLKSLLFQMKQFIIKVATVILAFFFASWFLSSFSFSLAFCGAEESMLAFLCGGLKFLFAPIGMNDWRIAYAALSGLIAKENVAGALMMFYGGTLPFGARSAFAFAVFMLMTSPCVSAIAATASEVGKRRALLYAAAQTVSALIMSYLVYFMLSFGTAFVFLLPVPLALLLIGKKQIETIHRKRTDKSQTLHGRRVRAGVLSLPHSTKRGKSQGKRQTRCK